MASKLVELRNPKFAAAHQAAVARHIAKKEGAPSVEDVPEESEAKASGLSAEDKKALAAAGFLLPQE